MNDNRRRYAAVALAGLAVILAQAAGAENMVTIGSRQYLEVNREPVFVIGSYGMPQGMTPAEAKAMGFNLLRSGADKTQMDARAEAGIYAWITFGGAFDHNGTDDAARRTQMKKVVDEYAGHPALLMWESIDEPAWTDKEPAKARVAPEGMEAGYNHLRTLEKDHPVYLNHAPRNTVETLRRYSAGMDIVCVDVYPIVPRGLGETFAITPEGRHGDLPNQTPSSVGEFVDKMKKVAYPGQAVFVVLQGFAWEGLRKAEERDESLVQYATYAESRFMAWNAIIHGANGLMYWGMTYTPRDHEFVQNLSKVLNEIRELEPMILGRDVLHKPVLRYAERGSTITDGVELMLRQVGETYTIVAANTSIDPAGVTFAALPEAIVKSGELEVLGENRSVTIRDGAFADEFEGLGVHIYRSRASR